MEYEVLNPVGGVDQLPLKGLNPRVKSLEGVTVGMFAGFKGHWPLILKEVENQLKERYPSAKFSHYQYIKDTSEIEKDSEYRDSFLSWLKGVDVVISGHGDAGSCALYLAYNTAFIERIGKPAVMLVNRSLVNIARSGASYRGVPMLRLVISDIPELSLLPTLEGVTEKVIRPEIAKVLDNIIVALTEPLTREEEFPISREPLQRIVFKGSLNEVNTFFYRNGWSFGMPIIPPTEEAVREMLMATDLPTDYVVATIPPRMGKATVEKIAINAVMAGCLPTYMPALIAAVQAITDPKVFIGFGRALEGYTCSSASWSPLMIINGPIRHDLHVNSKQGVMSPYFRTATIPLALGLIIMNIGGVRPGIEDYSGMGHECKFGVCIAENEEESPWEPIHVQYGFKKKESTVTICWTMGRRITFGGRNSGEILRRMCDVADPLVGFDPGCTYIMCPEVAKILAKEGWTKRDVISYVVEYARRPASEVNVRWLKENQHTWQLRGLPLPADPTRSVRKFWTDEHIVIVVAGRAGIYICDGGGDHGGPAIKKIELPSNWESLIEKYRDVKPPFTLY